MKLKKIRLPNAPPVTPEDKHELALLASGAKCPPKDLKSTFLCYRDFEPPADSQIVALVLHLELKNGSSECLGRLAWGEEDNIKQ
ncbi:hypothetical protein TNCT_274921 [Trichonephila clavata]|uniref:Uncharacterized protein n=1 Tax=Trichonephila clavata TaxID=2740835 RepID=A0A8X6IPS4_TRICU|nr:hypothetical protein TNCT_274921 [Trichonephila clavata]